MSHITNMSETAHIHVKNTTANITRSVVPLLQWWSNAYD